MLTRCCAVVLSLLRVHVHHLSLQNRLVAFFIIQSDFRVDPDLSCWIQDKPLAGFHGVVASAFEGDLLVDQRMVPIFVMCFEFPNGLCNRGVLLHFHRWYWLELRPLIVHVQHVYLHHHYSFLLLQICRLYLHIKACAATLIVQLNVWVYSDVSHVTFFGRKGSNDEAPKAPFDDAERDAIKLCCLVQVLSMNRANKYT